MVTVGICAPSNWIQPERFERGIEILKSLEVDVKIHPQVEERHFQCAGTHEVRAAALMDLYNDPEVDIIMATAGGHRALHLMGMLDYKKINKPLIGFSDTTALLNATFHKAGVTNIYGPPIASLADECNEQDLDMLKTFLHAGTLNMHLPAKLLKAGQTTEASHIIGGNFCLLNNLMNTDYQPKLEGAVLLLEDDGEAIRNLDRMLLHLKNQSVFHKVSAVVFGEFTNVTDDEHTGRPFAADLRSIILEHMQDVPPAVYTDAPFGHGTRLQPLPIGHAHTLLQKDGLSFKMTV